MMIKAYVALLLLLISVISNAGVIRDGASHFNQIGSIQIVKWAPARYTDDFKYDVVYYIPKQLKETTNAKALIYMHGGGGSTLTRDGSLRVALSYMTGDVQKLANDLDMVVVVPSASGLNWGGHTLMLRDLAQTIKKELNVDPNNIGLAGHSMGGMGITRSYSGLVDEFAYFLPMSAGMDVVHQTEQHLLKSFNVPYVHLQGRYDHFEIFIERCNEQLRRMKALEEKYNQASKFELVFYNGSHNPDYALTRQTLKKLQKNPRNIYQPTLYGALVSSDRYLVENNISYHYGDVSRYFWISTLEADRSKTEGVNFIAKVSGDEIQIEMEQRPEMIRKIRVFLSNKILSLDRPVFIKVNGDLKALHLPETNVLVGSSDETDPTFVFEEYEDVIL